MRRALTIAGFAVLLLIASGFVYSGFIHIWQNAGSNIGTFTTYEVVNCSTGMSCSKSNSTITMTTTSGTVANEFVTSPYTNATTSFSNVTGLSFAVAANSNYSVTCQILWQTDTATGGPKVQWTGPAAATAVAASLHSAVTTTTYIDATATAFSSPMADSGTVTTATNFNSIVTLGLLNGANAGTVQLQAAANGIGTLTIQNGSFCVSKI